MNMKRTICFLFFAACAAIQPLASQDTTPAWVVDLAKAYPDSQWLAVVESAPAKNTAESLALNSLARVFKTDITSLTKATQEFTQAIKETAKKKTVTLNEGRDFAQDVTTTSNVTGLIGVQTDAWAAKDGTVYAVARMNRQECAARYTAMIRENEGIIDLLKAEAGAAPATFDAFESLSFASTLAGATDNFQSLLEVLDSSAISRRPKYGNAGAVKALAQNAAKAIIVTVEVAGDEGGRIAKSFKSFFDKRGFRTSSAGKNAYLLSAEMELWVSDFSAEKYKDVRYTLTASVANSGGIEVFSFQEEGRSRHVNEEQARQLAIRKVEDMVDKDAFAKQFDAYLASLLK
jgi:hypothetical protein